LIIAYEQHGKPKSARVEAETLKEPEVVALTQHLQLLVWLPPLYFAVYPICKGTSRLNFEKRRELTAHAVEPAVVNKTVATQTVAAQTQGKKSKGHLNILPILLLDILNDEFAERRNS
jgi:hypothetical protein